MVKFIKEIQVKLEAIPTVGAVIYNAIVKRILSKAELEIAKDVVQRIKKGILIDIGSGTGYLSIEIGKRAPQLKIYGIDLSRKMVKIASGYGKDFENVKFKLANATELPFEDDSIDFIISTGSFHHWKHPIKNLNECYRVLKTKREAWIYDGCSNPPNNEKIKLKRNYGGFRYSILTQIVKLHGFDLEEYNTRIKDLLEHTKFKNDFEMVLIDGWMKIVFKK